VGFFEQVNESMGLFMFKDVIFYVYFSRRGLISRTQPYVDICVCVSANGCVTGSILLFACRQGCSF
jgi:hypothetical protein